MAGFLPAGFKPRGKCGFRKFARRAKGRKCGGPNAKDGDFGRKLAGDGVEVPAFFAEPLVNFRPVHAGLVAPAALIGALAALGCALWLGRGDGAFSRESVILAGIAVAAFLGALVALVKALNEESVTSIVFWIMWSSLRRRFVGGLAGLVQRARHRPICRLF